MWTTIKDRMSNRSEGTKWSNFSGWPSRLGVDHFHFGKDFCLLPRHMSGRVTHVLEKFSFLPPNFCSSIPPLSLSFSIANLFRKMIKKMNITRWRDPSGEEEKRLLSTQQQLCPGGRSKEDFLCAPFEDEQPSGREREQAKCCARK